MAIYLYKNPNTGEIKEVFQSVHDKHEYSEGGVVWKRVFTVPTASIDSKIKDPSSVNEFRKYTDNKKGTVGDIMDISGELSQKRAERNGGIDPMREKVYDRYKKIRRKEHPDVKKRQANEKLSKIGVHIE